MIYNTLRYYNYQLKAVLAKDVFIIKKYFNIIMVYFNNVKVYNIDILNKV